MLYFVHSLMSNYLIYCRPGATMAELSGVRRYDYRDVVVGYVCGVCCQRFNSSAVYSQPDSGSSLRVPDGSFFRCAVSLTLYENMMVGWEFTHIRAACVYLCTLAPLQCYYLYDIAIICIYTTCLLYDFI